MEVEVYETEKKKEKKYISGKERGSLEKTKQNQTP